MTNESSRIDCNPLEELFTKQIQTVRNAMAADLHDSVGNQFTTAKYRLTASIETAASLPCDGASELTAQLQRVYAALDVGHKNLWDIVRGKDYELLGSLVDAARSLVGSMFDDVPGVTATVYVQEEWPGIRHRFTEVELYRFLEGALANVAQHSSATEILVSFLRQPDGSPKLVVADNGRGFDVARQQESFGLRSLRSRAMNLGATCTMESAPSAGTIVTCTLET